MQLYVGTCHVVSTEIAVALAVLIENPADCEVRGVIRFLQPDEILGYLAEEASSRVELCCTRMHIYILPGRHKPCCVSNSIGTSSSILRTVQTWHCRIFFMFPKMEQLAGTHFANDDIKEAGWITRWQHGMTRVYTNWCQVTSAIMSKTTMWNSRQRYVPKFVYSVSVLLLLLLLLLFKNSKFEHDPVLISFILNTDFWIFSEALCLLVFLSLLPTSTHDFYGIMVNILDFLAKQWILNWLCILIGTLPLFLHFLSLKDGIKSYGRFHTVHQLSWYPLLSCEHLL